MDKAKEVLMEILEIQIILYFILGLMLLETDHRILGWMVVVYAAVTLIGALITATFYVVEEDVRKKLKDNK